jgi:O-antigen/teichoic acid export membrane protein
MSNSSPPGSGGESITFLGDFSKKLAINTLFNFLGRFWAFIATFLLTPYILRHLTANEFGVWVVFNVFASSFTLLDLGLGSAFVKFISTYDAHKDTDSINRVIYSGLAFYCILGALFVGLGSLVGEHLFRWLGISGVVGLSTIYRLALIACALSNVAAMFLGVFRGIQRMDKSNAIEIGIILLNSAGTVFVLQGGFGLMGLAVNAAVTALISVVIAWRLVRRSVPRLRSGKHFDGALLGQMFRYGAQILVSRVGSVVCFQLPNLIVAKFAGVAAVPFYEVSARLSASVRAVPLLMMSALIPATSELSARNEKAKIVRAYTIASKYVAMTTIGLVGFVILEAHSIIRLWLGPGFEQSAILVQLLVLGYGANVLGGPASQTGAGVGRPEFDMRSTLLLTFLSPVLGIALVAKYGIAGVAAGTASALVAAAIYLLFTFHRHYIETTLRELAKEIHVRPIAAAASGAAAILLLRTFLPAGNTLEQPRFVALVRLALNLMVFSSIYVAFLVALRQITLLDWRNLTSLLAFGFEFLRHPFRQRVKIYR